MLESPNKPSLLKLYRVSEVRGLDRYAIETLGIAAGELMHRAGLAAFSVLRARWPAARTISVLCGPGNNGGDGYIVARLAMEAGMDVRVYSITSPSQLRGDARNAYHSFARIGGSILEYVPADFEGAEILVDGLLGSGLDRPVSGHYGDVIAAINGYSGKTISLDIPSGLNADTGMAMGVAVKADVTVTFVGMKRGLLTGEGLEYCGDLIYEDLALPEAVFASETPSAYGLGSWHNGMPARSRATHKGKFGHVLVIGGERGYCGAVRMAAEAASRVGAGLVSVATRPEHAGLINLGRPELMCHGVASAEDAGPLLARATVVAIGPGLGQSEWAENLFAQALTTELPLVVDADALNLLSAKPQRHGHWILTPHPGEAARLLGTSVADIQRDRFAAVEALQARYGGTVVLKGSGTLVRGATGVTYVSTLGNPGMASGGMGDVLTGVIAGLLAQGLIEEEAACSGVQLHGAAGDCAASLDGERGLLAADLMMPLRRLINQ